MCVVLVEALCHRTLMEIITLMEIREQFVGLGSLFLPDRPLE